MKRILSLLLTLGAISFAANAQSTMPAIGTNTPKGEVAKTDASVNQVNAADRVNSSSKMTKSSSKRAGKMKTTKTKTTSTM